MRHGPRKLKPLGECSKTLSIKGEPIKDNEPSEWAMCYALHRFHDRDFTQEEFGEELTMAMILQELLEANDQGHVDLSYSDSGELTAKITEKGKKYVEDDLL